MDKDIYETINISDEQIDDTSLTEVTESTIESRMRLIESFSLTLTNLQQFQDTVRADMDSIANRIMADEEQIQSFQKKIDSIVNDKRVKSQNWEGHIFYTLFNKQKEVTDMLVKISILKSLYIQYLINVNNKMSQAMKALRKEFVEIERLKAETKMMDKIMEMTKKEKEQWFENYNKNIETRFESINKMFKEIMEEKEKYTRHHVEVRAVVERLIRKYDEVLTELEELKKKLNNSTTSPFKPQNASTDLDFIKKQVNHFNIPKTHDFMPIPPKPTKQPQNEETNDAKLPKLKGPITIKNVDGIDPKKQSQIIENFFNFFNREYDLTREQTHFLWDLATSKKKHSTVSRFVEVLAKDIKETTGKDVDKEHLKEICKKNIDIMIKKGILKRASGYVYTFTNIVKKQIEKETGMKI